jgi:hypothetical protein
MKSLLWANDPRQAEVQVKFSSAWSRDGQPSTFMRDSGAGITHTSCAIMGADGAGGSRS